MLKEFALTLQVVKIVSAKFVLFSDRFGTLVSWIVVLLA